MSIGKTRKVKFSTYSYFSNMENCKGTSSIPPFTSLEIILVVCGEIWSGPYGIIEKII